MYKFCRSPVVKNEGFKKNNNKNCSIIIRVQFVRLQENEVEQPSSFHKSEASNRFFCGKAQMSVSAGFRVTGGEVSKGRIVK